MRGRNAVDLDTLASTDVVALDDSALREELLNLLVLADRVNAEITRRVDVFDRRGLAEPDGFRTTKSWLVGFGRRAAGVAERLVKAARVLRDVPKLATATQAGDVTPEHVQQVVRLTGQVGVERVAEVDATLADAARVLDLPRFQLVCERVAAHVHPDGGADPAKDFERRAVTLAPVDGMMWLRGQLDVEGGATLATALDALMTPPSETDERTAAQRRADALIELARIALAGGKLPAVGGQRPQVGVLLYPQALSPATLAKLAEVHRDNEAGRRLRQLLDRTDETATDWSRPGVPMNDREHAAAEVGRTGDQLRGATPQPVEVTDAQAANVSPQRAMWSGSGWADPPWLNWTGPISPVVAQRIACDADIWRIILNPGTGMPLDVGRGYRLVPHWIRRALVARDRGCRWPGCTGPPEWCDAHHLDAWADGGETRVDRCCLLCRYHHGLVHEGGWGIHLHPETGEVTVTRPGGFRYDLPGRSMSWTGPSSRRQ